MAKWESIFTGTIENRHVQILRYDDGGYKVCTTQGADDPGVVKSDDTSTMIIPPTEKGRKITIEGETAEEIKKDLLIEGFSEMASNEIVGKLCV